jgi:hypothetical protein
MAADPDRRLMITRERADDLLVPGWDATASLEGKVDRLHDQM